MKSTVFLSIAVTAFAAVNFPGKTAGTGNREGCPYNTNPNI